MTGVAIQKALHSFVTHLLQGRTDISLLQKAVPPTQYQWTKNSKHLVFGREIHMFSAKRHALAAQQLQIDCKQAINRQ